MKFSQSPPLAQALLATAVLLVLILFVPRPLQSQTFSVLHSFTGGVDGAMPYGALTLDSSGNLYGTASAGGFTGNNCGAAGCGTVFKVTRRNSGWIFTPLYNFQGNSDAATPYAGVTVGPNGTLYGTSLFGGFGTGTVFNLRPPAHATGNLLGGWSDTVVHAFGIPTDGMYPAYGSVVFDPAGNLYGTTYDGGFECGFDTGYCGTVFRLSPSGAGWTKTTFYFPGNSGGGNPLSGVVLDSSGHLFGTTGSGNTNPVVYELTPSGPGWFETTLYTFAFSEDARGGVIVDGSGNLFGTTLDSAYQLSPDGSQWDYTLLSTFVGSSGPWSGMVRDPHGNLYGTTCADGTLGHGSVFKLTPSQTGWTEADVYDFTGGADGSCPIGGMALDANGNLYGTTSWGGGGCGQQGCGVVWRIASVN